MEILKNIIFFFAFMVMIGVFMKIAYYVGQRIGLYEMIKGLWKQINKHM